MADLTFHHLGVAVPDLDDAITTYESIFGYSLTAGPFADPAQQACVCFLQPERSGDPVIEAIAPLGDDSHVQRLIDKGAGAYHACYETNDLDGTMRRCEDCHRPLVTHDWLPYKKRSSKVMTGWPNPHWGG